MLIFSPHLPQTFSPPSSLIPHSAHSLIPPPSSLLHHPTLPYQAFPCPSYTVSSPPKYLMSFLTPQTFSLITHISSFLSHSLCCIPHSSSHIPHPSCLSLIPHDLIPHALSLSSPTSLLFPHPSSVIFRPLFVFPQPSTSSLIPHLLTYTSPLR